MKKAVIDIGTNSVKYLMAELGEKGSLRICREIAAITGLGEATDQTGEIKESAAIRTVSRIKDFAVDASKYGAGEIRLVGTMALRRAHNADVFLRMVREITGLEVEVLSGDEEARLSFTGVVSDFDFRDGMKLCAIDSGGGSTEIVFAEKNEMISRVSLKTGALFLTEKYLSKEILLPGDLEKTDKELDLVFGEVRNPFATDMAIAAGGNAVSMASVFNEMKKYDPVKVHGTVLSKDEIDRQIKLYFSKTAAERRKISGLDPNRADIILAGACIIRRALRSCGLDAVTISEKGLRHGMMYSMFGLRNRVKKERSGELF